MRLSETTPILRIFDVAKAREFYVDFLGFAVDWEHRFDDEAPLYMRVSRDDCVLHLSEHHGDSTPGSAAMVETTGIDDLEKELIERDYAYNRPHVEEASWGGRVLSVVDPFGNRLTFAESPD